MKAITREHWKHAISWRNVRPSIAEPLRAGARLPNFDTLETFRQALDITEQDMEHIFEIGYCDYSAPETVIDRIAIAQLKKALDADPNAAKCIVFGTPYYGEAAYLFGEAAKALEECADLFYHAPPILGDMEEALLAAEDVARGEALPDLFHDYLRQEGPDEYPPEAEPSDAWTSAALEALETRGHGLTPAGTIDFCTGDVIDEIRRLLERDNAAAIAQPVNTATQD